MLAGSVSVRSHQSHAEPAAALAVAEGPDGIGAGIKANPGKAYVDMSAVDEQTSQMIAALVTSSGGRFLEVRLSSSFAGLYRERALS